MEWQQLFDTLKAMRNATDLSEAERIVVERWEAESRDDALTASGADIMADALAMAVVRAFVERQKPVTFVRFDFDNAVVEVGSEWGRQARDIIVWFDSRVWLFGEFDCVTGTFNGMEIINRVRAYTPDFGNRLAAAVARAITPET